MQEQKEVLTQRERLANALRAIAENVTPQDKKDCEAKLNVSPFTISTYLKGNCMNLDTATAMLAFFTQRIKERDQVINNSTSIFNKAS